MDRAVVRASTPIERQIAMAEYWALLTERQVIAGIKEGRLTVSAGIAGLDAADDILATLRGVAARGDAA